LTFFEPKIFIPSIPINRYVFRVFEKL